jgi:hypothetical protein
MKTKILCLIIVIIITGCSTSIVYEREITKKRSFRFINKVDSALVKMEKGILDKIKNPKNNTTLTTVNIKVAKDTIKK